MKFDREELGDLYNCVSIVITNRERDNEVLGMFDEDFVDPIIDRLYALEQKIIDKIDKYENVNT
jgi:hypothetical protein